MGLLLVTSAGLLVRTPLHLEQLSPGFDGSNVLTASVSLQDARYRSAQSVNRLYRQTLERLRQTPGVEAAAEGLHVPYQRWLNAGVEILEPRAAREERLVEMTTMNYVTPGYFQVHGIPLRTARDIEERDTAGSLPVAMVNNTFARKYLRGLPAVGSHIKIHMDGTDRQIVGVVRDVRESPSFGDYGPLDSMPAVYVPATQLPDQNFQLIHTWFSPVWVLRGSRFHRENDRSRPTLGAIGGPAAAYRELSHF